jgi:hypothetical protein
VASCDPPSRVTPLFTPQYWQADGTRTASAQAAGSTNQVQFNRRSKLAASPSLTFDPDTRTLNVGALTIGGQPVATSASGTQGSIQFNDNGDLGSDPALSWDKNTDTLAAKTLVLSDDLTAGGETLVVEKAAQKTTVQGTLLVSGVTQTGDLAVTGNLTYRGGSLLPAGSTGQVQYRSSAGYLAGATGVTFDPVTGVFSVASLTGTGTFRLPSIPQSVTTKQLFFNTGTGAISQGDVPTTVPGGATGSLQYRDGATFQGSSKLTYNDSTPKLSIVTAGGNPQLRLQQTGVSAGSPSAIDITKDAIVFRDNDDNELASLYTTGLTVPKVYHTDNLSIPVGGVVYKKDDGELGSSDLIGYDEGAQRFYCPSLVTTGGGTTTTSLVTTSIVLTGQSGTSTPVDPSLGLPTGGTDGQLLVKSGSTNYVSTWRSLTSALVNYITGGAVGKVLTITGLNAVEWVTPASSSSSSLTIQYAQFYQRSELTNLTGGGAETAMLWETQVEKNVQGLSITAAGVITITQPGLYNLQWSIGMNGSSATGSRQTWLRFTGQTQRLGATSSTSGGSTIFFLGSSYQCYISAGQTMIIFLSHNSSNVSAYGTNSSAPTRDTSVSKLSISRVMK